MEGESVSMRAEEDKTMKDKRHAPTEKVVKHSKKNKRARSSSSESDSSSSSGTSSSSSDDSRKRRRRRKKAKRSKENRKFNDLLNAVNKLQQQVADNCNNRSNAQSVDGDYVVRDISPSFLEEENSDSTGMTSKLPTEGPGLTLSLDVSTKIKEPTIPPASEEMLRELNKLQHFDQHDWNSVRYADIQKQCLHSPGFTNLEPNEEVKRYDGAKFTANMEKAFAGITFALLKQRDSLQSDMRDFLAWAHQNDTVSYESIHAKISEIFTSGEYFKSLGDTFQLVCGHRAELIQHRREGVLASVKDPFHKNALRKIPPSCSNLFNADQFSSALEKAGGLKKIFWSKNMDRYSAPQNDPGTSTETPVQSKSGKSAPPQKNHYRQHHTKPHPNHSSFRGRGGKSSSGRGGSSYKAKPRTNSPSSRRDKRDHTRRN